MKHLNKLWILFAILSVFSCNSDDDNDLGCSNIACTEIFVTITVSIEDQSQNPVALTSFQVINTENGEDVTPPFSDSGLEFFQQNGSYPIAEDGSIETDQVRELQFKGFIDGQEVISSTYVATADCCHINLVSGDTTLILE
ncbi:hypothetical protein [Dokdonia sp.]|uniref:hypothetical protein n=1 Tax=Dokdonia sp. TaxID=2024995 RepID=UPI00326481D3